MLHDDRTKMWHQLCDIIFPKKIQSAKNKKHTIFWNDKFYIWAKVQVAGFKNKKDE